MSTTQALEQGIQRAKNCWPQGSPDEARSSPGNDSGNRHAPDSGIMTISIHCTGPAPLQWLSAPPSFIPQLH